MIKSESICKHCNCTFPLADSNLLPITLRLLANNILRIGDGRYHIVESVDLVHKTSIKIHVPTPANKCISIELSQLKTAGAQSPDKICFFKTTVAHQAREAGIDANLTLPRLVNELAHELEGLGLIYSYVSQSTSRTEIPDHLVKSNHIHFVCGGDLSCQIGNHHIQLELIYEVTRTRLVSFEPIGPCGFGC
ncbi:MAG: hypothetical protein K8F91_00710 [Candidatus Obscuribacterales bacterium]|nr:hypothetical protein [Candidatus Obscuribacterales bacterium]